MTVTMIFPLVVAVAELIAGIVYATQGKWGLAFAWLCYSLACVGLALGGE